MLSLRDVLVLAASVLSAAAIPRGAVAAGGSGPVLAPSDDQPMDGLLSRQEIIVGRLTFNSQSEPGTSGWELLRQGKTITLDTSHVSAHAERLRGKRVRVEGHYVFAGLGRTSIVTRLRRA